MTGVLRTLYVGGNVYSPGAPFATSMLVEGDRIAWLGEDAAAEVHREAVDAVVHLEGRLVTPGFVDAHIHATSAGLTMEGLDLTRVQSKHELLALLAQACSVAGADDVVLGHGWDETTWAGDPASRAIPSVDELDAVAAGRLVYLSRIDVHSALASSALRARAPQCAGHDGFDAHGPLSRQAHLAVREAALSAISQEQRTRAHRLVRSVAARRGIVCLQENAGPSISSPDDLAALLSLAQAEPGPLVHGYWAELAANGGIEHARALGALGVAGDLFVDGAVGSRTACLCQPYSDAESTSGAAYLTVDEVADHVMAATRAGMQAGFHVIGDCACRTVTAGFRAAADALGVPAVRAAAHRIEHAEMLSDEDIAVLGELGVIASMQPMFDSLWGGVDGMYDLRLGAERRAGMNRFADLLGAGVALAFSSDAPVTAMEPWLAVRAAALHRTPEQRISVRAAFSAHTRGGWRAMRDNEAGVLAPGAPAHLAIWDAPELAVQVPDSRVSAWSTDPRSATPALPVLAEGTPLPTCAATFVAGECVYSSGGMDGLHGTGLA